MRRRARSRIGGSRFVDERQAPQVVKEQRGTRPTKEPEDPSGLPADGTAHFVLWGAPLDRQRSSLRHHVTDRSFGEILREHVCRHGSESCSPRHIVSTGREPSGTPQEAEPCGDLASERAPHGLDEERGPSEHRRIKGPREPAFVDGALDALRSRAGPRTPAGQTGTHVEADCAIGRARELEHVTRRPRRPTGDTGSEGLVVFERLPPLSTALLLPAQALSSAGARASALA